MDYSLTPLDAWVAAKIGCPGMRLTPTALEAYQLDRLNETLQLARARSPFYSKHLVHAPHSMTCLHDLHELPFTTAEMIRSNGLHFLCASQDEIRRVVTLGLPADTSGTTGHPKRLYFTRDDQEQTVNFFHIGMSTFTAPRDRVLILLPGERPGSVGDLLATALQRLGAHPIKYGPVRDVAETLEVLSREKVNGLVGAPTQALALARYSGGLKLKSVLLTTDHVPNAIVRAVEHAWDCLVYNHYGMTEMGLGGGVECQARRGYHLREADLYFEIVHPASGEPVADGEPGEVVFTTLTRHGMPLIRYRTGDISRFIPGDCPCGTALKTLERVKQRTAGNIAIGAGQTLMLADLDEAIFAVEGTLNFTAALSRQVGYGLYLEVYAVEDADDHLAARIEAALESIPAIHVARSAGGLEVHLSVQAKGYMAGGMAKRTISHQHGG